MHRRYTSFHHTIHNFCTCICIHTRAFDNHNAKTRHEENTSQHKLAHRSMTMIITLVIITVDTIMHNQVSIVINVIIVIITIISSKNMLANQSSSSSPSPQTASKPSFFHHHNHNRRHHNAQENKIKHAPHQNFTHHTSQSRFNAIAIAIAAKSNSGIRLQFVNNMHNSNKKTNFKTMQNQHRQKKSKSPVTTNNRDEKNHNHNQNNYVIVIINAPIHDNRFRNKTNNTRLQSL